MIYVNHIDVCPRRVYVTEGKTNRELRAEASPVNATCREIKWISDDPEIAEINEQTGYITGKKVGTVQVYAQATDGSGEKERVTVVVEEEADISLDEYYAIMYVNQSITLTADVIPARIAREGVRWDITDTSVVDIKTFGNTIKITAKQVGNAVVVVSAVGNSSCYACCQLDVRQTTETQVFAVVPASLTMDVGDIRQLTAQIPTYCANANVRWTSEDDKRATVDIEGNVLALKAGTVKITARLAGSDNPACCTVTIIDPSKKVIVSRDDDESFSVYFPSDRVWESVGCDLSLRSNRSSDSFAVSKANNILNKRESRYLFNACNMYTAKELAYLYRFDPAGVVYYMENAAIESIKKQLKLSEDNSDPYEKLLEFKDNVYLKIFDEKPGWFAFDIVDGKVVYGIYNMRDREYYFTNAEIIFGFHKYFNFNKFASDVVKELFLGLPVISDIKSALDCYQALFVSGSIVGLCTDKAKSYLEDYLLKPVEDSLVEDLGEWFGGKVFALCVWCINLHKTIIKSAINNYTAPNSEDLKIYKKILDQKDYSTVFVVGNSVVSMQEFFNSCIINE